MLFIKFVNKHYFTTNYKCRQNNQFKLRQMTGTQIYINWDGVLVDDMLNDEGNQFAMYYFNNKDEWKYIDDYSGIFTDDGETLYHVQVT
ncbi:hypothetical protein F8161_18035 [Bacillus cereus]|nr:hypothetical protein F8167_12090 [Bacillus cereus]KAB2458706.1 hypothetical protein F8161_18035 [Bacillus cereus]KAB2477087.1 hypothetical protein F8159_19925 [Bacillus cereus]